MPMLDMEPVQSWGGIRLSPSDNICMLDYDVVAIDNYIRKSREAGPMVTDLSPCTSVLCTLPGFQNNQRHISSRQQSCSVRCAARIFHFDPFSDKLGHYYCNLP